MIKKTIWQLFKLLFLVATIVCAILIIVFFHFSKDLPDYSQLLKYHPPLVTRVYSADGKLIEEYARENRVFVPISAVPKSLIEAFIAAEDKNFYSHSGIDFIGVFRASISNVSNFIQNKRLEGASTITQQVVKNFLVGSERSMGRKIKEAVLSYTVSKTFSKEQILELYLNQTYFGKGAYGVASAAQSYFNKSVEDLTLAESAFIAGLPKAPSNYNPEKNYQKAKDRRDYVISRVLEDGYVTQEAAMVARDTPIKLIRRDSNNTITAGFFAENVRAKVIDMIGEEEFYTGGYSIITTLDSKLQRKAEQAFIDQIRKYDASRGFRKPITQINFVNDWHQELLKINDPEDIKEYKLAIVIAVKDTEAQIGFKDGTMGIIPIAEMKWAKTILKSVKDLLNKGDVIVVAPAGKNFALKQIPLVNGAVQVVDPLSGCVLAQVGGYDFKVSKFNRATQALRQPGSLIKAFVYLAALEENIPPNAIYHDAPIILSQGAGMPNWEPKNYKNDYLGKLTLRAGLEKSRNLITVRIANQIGIPKIAEVVSRFGINNNPPLYYSMVLGSLETTLEKMSNAYAMVAGKGNLLIPHYIELIQDRNGKTLYRRSNSKCINCSNNIANIDEFPNVTHNSTLNLTDDASRFQLVSILKGVATRGTASKLGKLGHNIAAKTGTTNNSYDTWCIAFTPDLLIGTYVGYDTPKSLGKTATGSSISLPIIEDIFTEVLKNKPILDHAIPSSIVLTKIDPKTGSLYDGSGSIVEAFKLIEDKDISPLEYGDDGQILYKDLFDKVTSPEEQKQFFENIGEVY